jgi:hypothetical protein
MALVSLANSGIEFHFSPERFDTNNPLPHGCSSIFNVILRTRMSPASISADELRISSFPHFFLNSSSSFPQKTAAYSCAAPNACA